jgi:hypothetical protein
LMNMTKIFISQSGKQGYVTHATTIATSNIQQVRLNIYDFHTKSAIVIAAP